MRINPDEILQIDNLAVVAFELGDRPDTTVLDWYASLQKWREENQIPMAESCARQVWYGRDCDFESFPDDSVPILRGAPAYAYLLKVFSEVDNDKEWSQDVNNAASYRMLREAYLEAYPERKPLLEKFHRFFMSDSTLLRGQILSELKPRAWKDVIREVSGQRANDTALLIGTLNRHGVLSESTLDAVHAMRRTRNSKVERIVVTNPDSDTARKIAKEIRAIRPSVTESLHMERIDFNELPLCFELCDRVIVDLPIDQDKQADTFIMQAWNNRERMDNRLTHVRGKPQLGNCSTPLWRSFADANPDSVRLHEDLDVLSYKLEEYNGQVIERAKDSFAIAAGLRAGHVRPNAQLLKTIPRPFETPQGPLPGVLSCG